LSTRYHRTPALANSPIAARHTPLHALACLARFAFTNHSLSVSAEAPYNDRVSAAAHHHGSPQGRGHPSTLASPPSRLFRFLSFPPLTLFRSFLVCCARVQTKKERSASVSTTASKTEAKLKKLKKKFQEKNKVGVTHARVSLVVRLRSRSCVSRVSCCLWDRSSRTR
jgi:hypothetical protein